MRRGDAGLPTPLAASFQSVRQRGLRFAAVSLGATLLSQTLLFALARLFTGPFALPTQPAWVSANFLAVAISGIPSFYLNRRWVWGKTSGGVSVKREVLPFWGFAFAGLALSTLTVAFTATITTNPLFVNAANLSVFGALWVVKLVVFDKKVFGAPAGNEHP